MSTFISKSEVIRHQQFRFVGTPARTNNQLELKGEGVIPSLWSNFYENQILELIPGKKNSSVLALYTQYESDETGTYTIALGTEITEDSGAPSELGEFIIPESNYIVFTTRKGPVHEVVVEAWQEIWEWSKHNERAFQSDFELYDARAIDMTNGQVDIYISVK
ncbi:GyrI-like domain-containing protein [Paenibacillus sp. Marseille-Q4541]|uniref:GyrI-like domain-containing protein n=1 Tax=Paenibacillus sp. Marseille-Q4541 TaxID=2831522 RepID=UPI002018C7D2|nr:GyrI-like domain-containing protein [Paenibacillus sp. Marseille-Q4541]